MELSPAAAFPALDAGTVVGASLDLVGASGSGLTSPAFT